MRGSGDDEVVVDLLSALILLLMILITGLLDGPLSVFGREAAALAYLACCLEASICLPDSILLPVISWVTAAT